MSFYNGILNLTNWSGNVILPTLAYLFLAIAIIQFSKGKEDAHAMYGGFMRVMASGGRQHDASEGGNGCDRG
jgi:hypothetical protein